MGKLQETLAKNVRMIRRDRAMTQEDLADRAGLSSRYIGQVERAQAAATITVLEQLAEALGVEPADLVR
jgi:transcriptional regulator with XRE-family HTH domain